MNLRKIKFLLLVFLAGCFVMTGLTGCMKAKPKPGESFTCTSESNLHTVIAKEASLEAFTCMIKKWEGADTLHFDVAVKNISNEDQRFKVNIFLENGKAVGGLLPRKTKKGLVKPGETVKFTYPVKGMDCAPGKIDLFIKTMAK